MSEDIFVEVNGEKIKIPDIALGKFMPDSVNALILKCEKAEERAKNAERKAFLYFWGGIIASALFMVGGYLLGKFC